MPCAVVTDFDGTLYRSDHRFNEADLDALCRAGERGITRVIATGRSLHSYRGVVPHGTLPVDYIVFSSGAGLLRESDDALLQSSQLDTTQVLRAANVLMEIDLPFMLHRPVPENHRFVHRTTTSATDDFHRRVAHYRDHSAPLVGCPSDFGPAAQLLAIAPPHRVDLFDRVRNALPALSVIRATSPMDHASLWIEVFPPGVSKSETCATLLGGLGIASADVLAIGNDYNDEDILDWAGRGVVTANAPPSLRDRFEVVPSNDEAGVATALASHA